MNKEKIERLEGVLANCSSVLYLTQKANSGEDLEDVKGACSLVADVIDEVRGELAKAYVKLAI